METSKTQTKSFVITEKKDKLSAILRPEIQQAIWKRQVTYSLQDYLQDTSLNNWKPFSLKFSESDLHEGFTLEEYLPRDVDPERSGEALLTLEVLSLCFTFVKYVKAKNYQLDFLTIGDGGERFEIPENQLTMYCTFLGNCAQWVSSKDLLIDGPRSQVSVQFIKDNASVQELEKYDVLLIKGNQNVQVPRTYLRIAPVSTLSIRIKTLKLEH